MRVSREPGTLFRRAVTCSVAILLAIPVVAAEAVMQGPVVQKTAGARFASPVDPSRKNAPPSWPMTALTHTR